MTANMGVRIILIGTMTYERLEYIQYRIIINPSPNRFTLSVHVFQFHELSEIFLFPKIKVLVYTEIV